MSLSIHILTWNEEVILPYTLGFYLQNWHSNDITIWDNHSTDKTKDIVESFGCRYRTFNSFNKFDDTFNMKIKNECWKRDKTEWVLVADCDEWIDVNKNNLLDFNQEGATIVRTEGYDLVSPTDTTTKLNEITTGVKNIHENKPCLFSRKHFTSINYEAGAHDCRPYGMTKWWSGKPVPLYHIKYFSKPFLSNRYQNYVKRLSDTNRYNGWSFHYSQDDMDNLFEVLRKEASTIR